jgi:hypothetical protein
VSAIGLREVVFNEMSEFGDNPNPRGDRAFARFAFRREIYKARREI